MRKYIIFLSVINCLNCKYLRSNTKLSVNMRNLSSFIPVPVKTFLLCMMSTILKISRTLFEKLIFPNRFFQRNTCAVKEKGNRDKYYKWRRMAFNWSGFNKYGLFLEDIFDEGDYVVHEALRRLPKDVLDARNFRLIRAAQLDFLKIYLPKEQWHTYEKDMENRYLKPYMDEILAEETEIYEFGCVNYDKEDWPAHQVK